MKKLDLFFYLFTALNLVFAGITYSDTFLYIIAGLIAIYTVATYAETNMKD